MGFMATRFSFDGIPCERYGLCIYDVDGNNNKATPFASAGKLVSDAIPFSGQNYLYGRDLSSPLEFDLVFGLDPCNRTTEQHLTRQEMDTIANWLTQPKDYRWLEVEQPDLEDVRYRCVVSDLEPINIEWLPFAFKATVTCDSPYAYYKPQSFTYSSVSGNTDATIENKSTIGVPYKPVITITLSGNSTSSSVFKIKDKDSGEYVFTLPLPSLSAGTIVTVDSKHGILKSSGGENLYSGFDFKWFELGIGINNLSIEVENMTADIDIACEFPVNVGG